MLSIKCKPFSMTQYKHFKIIITKYERISQLNNIYYGLSELVCVKLIDTIQIKIIQSSN